MSKNLKSYTLRFILISAILVVGSFFLFEKSTNNYVFAQSEDKVSIEFNEAQFFPETKDSNLLEIIVDYETNDRSLIDSTINGVMEVFASNGTLLKVSSYPDGFRILDSGMIGFKTSFMDDSLNSVTANLSLTDLEKTELISNTVETTVSYNNDEDLEPLITPQGLRSANTNNANQANGDTDEIKSTISASNPDLTINSVSSFFRADSFNIVGEVVNKSDGTKEYVKLSVTLYDDTGKVIGTDFGFTDPSDIFPQDSAPFSILITDSDVSNLNSISSYKIQVSSL